MRLHDNPEDPMYGNAVIRNRTDHRRLRVLCVGREPCSLHFRKLLLEQRGYAVTTVTSSAQAVDLAGSVDFDLIVLEFQAPVVNRMTAELKFRRPQLPILFLSCGTEACEAQPSFDASDASLSKAAGPRALLGKVDELLAQSSRMTLTSRVAAPVISTPSEVLADLLNAVVNSTPAPRIKAVNSQAEASVITEHATLPRFACNPSIAEEKVFAPTPSILRRLVDSMSLARAALPATGAALAMLLLVFLLHGAPHLRIQPSSLGSLPAESPSTGPETARKQTNSSSENTSGSPPFSNSGPLPTSPSSYLTRSQHQARKAEPQPAGLLNVHIIRGNGVIQASAPPRLMGSILKPSLPPLPPPAPAKAILAPAVLMARPAGVGPDFVLHSAVKGHSSWVTAVAFDPRGEWLASASWDRTIKFWDPLTGRALSTLPGKVHRVEALACSRDGHLLAAEDSNNSVTLWNTATGRELRTIPGGRPVSLFGSNWVYSIAISPDNRWVAYGLDDQSVRLAEISTGRAVRDLHALPRSVIYIAFSPDGRWLASGADDKNIDIWDVATGKVIRRLSGHKKGVNAVVFSPDGRLLASASGDKSVKIWDFSTGRAIRTLTGHRDRVTSIAFSPDGRWLASGSWDHTVKIWDVRSGRELQTLSGEAHDIYSIAFDATGRWLAAGNQDGAVDLWRSAEMTIEASSNDGEPKSWAR